MKMNLRYLTMSKMLLKMRKLTKMVNLDDHNAQNKCQTDMEWQFLPSMYRMPYLAWMINRVASRKRCPVKMLFIGKRHLRVKSTH